MPSYEVKVPIAGYVVVEVKANSEKEAVKKALEKDYSLDDVYEWDGYETIVRNNVFQGHLNQAYAKEI